MRKEASPSPSFCFSHLAILYLPFSLRISFTFLEGKKKRFFFQMVVDLMSTQWSFQKDILIDSRGCLKDKSVNFCGVFSNEKKKGREGWRKGR
jgi:hypothetical protein